MVRSGFGEKFKNYLNSHNSGCDLRAR